MAGGTFISENKVRPGAYINFKSVATPQLVVGDRGIATVAMSMTWYNEGEVVDVLSSDLLETKSRKLLGYTAFDTAESLVARTILSNCYRCLFYPLNTGGAAAGGTISGITLTAAKKGTSGNKITVQISENKLGTYDVKTFFSGVQVDAQTVKDLKAIENNDFVIFDTASASELEEQAGTTLTGGTDGTAEASTAFPKYFEVMRRKKWQTMAIITDHTTVNPLAKEFIEQMREDEGRGVQVVIYDEADGTYNYEGVIVTDQSLTINGEELKAELVPALIAGVTAGAAINQSNTFKVIEGCTAMSPEYSNTEIIDKLNAGKLVFSMNINDNIVIEKDINTYHEFEPEKNYTFSKNRAIRVMDEMRESVRKTWETSYVGKVSNTTENRASFKADVVQYVEQLQNLDAVDTEYQANENITVERGDKVDAVRAYIYELPVIDGMEILYMTVQISA